MALFSPYSALSWSSRNLGMGVRALAVGLDRVRVLELDLPSRGPLVGELVAVAVAVAVAVPLPQALRTVGPVALLAELQGVLAVIVVAVHHFLPNLSSRASSSGVSCSSFFSSRASAWAALGLFLPLGGSFFWALPMLRSMS